MYNGYPQYNPYMMNQYRQMNSFDSLQFVNGKNANTTAQIQKVLDTIATNRMAEMQNQINQLQLQSAMCGVVRYPNATTYNAGCNPYFNGNCGCATGTTF